MSRRARLLRVRPAYDLRREFAAWASAHRVRTVTEVEFGVPAPLLDVIPGGLLVGAVVDGQPYVAAPRSRPREAEKAGADAGGSAAGGAAAGSAAPVPSRLDPEPDPEPDPDWPVPVPPPEPVLVVNSADSCADEGEESPADDDSPGEELTCGICGHEARTAHGLKIHRGRRHPGGGE